MTSLRQSIKGLARITPETLSTRLGRVWAYVCYNLFDHGFLRIWWTNLEEIAPGVWRSNQPGPQRMAQYARMGIKSVLILRGSGEKAHFQLEQEAAARHSIKLHVLGIHARKADRAGALLALLRTFEEIEGPWLMHCKSGADRAGLASALYLLSIGRPLSEARKQLSWRYVHLKSTLTGVLDVLLDQYEETLEEEPMDIKTWLETRYDRARLTKEFQEGRRHGKPWPRK